MLHRDNINYFSHLRQTALTFYLTIVELLLVLRTDYQSFCTSATICVDFLLDNRISTLAQGETALVATLSVARKFWIDRSNPLISLHFVGLTVARKALKSLTKWGLAPGAS